MRFGYFWFTPKKAKGGWYSEGILTLVTLPKKGSNLTPNNLFTEKGGKFNFSAQGWDLAPFVINGIKAIIPSEIKPPLDYSLFSTSVTSFGSESFFPKLHES